MKKILVAGAGGAPTEGVVFSLLKNPNNYVIGMGSNQRTLFYLRLIKNITCPTPIRMNTKINC